MGRTLIVGMLFTAVVMTIGSASAQMKIYVDEVDLPETFIPGLSRLALGYDLGAVDVNDLVPQDRPTIGQLIANSPWDFSGHTAADAIAQIGSIATHLDSSQSCTYDKIWNLSGSDCYLNPGSHNYKLLREDRDIGNVWTCEASGLPCNPAGDCGAGDYCVHDSVIIITERETTGSGVTVWVRAGIEKEGRDSSAGIGTGESRYCYGISDADSRPEVPLYRFTHQDADGWYMTVNDSWANTPFDCDELFFPHRCPDGCSGLTCPAATEDCTGHDGTQSGVVVGSGEVLLPSGHRFNALLVRTMAEFCSYANFFSCSLGETPVRTVVYLWEVPQIGSVVRLQSELHVDSPTGFSTVAGTDIRYGLFPPLELTVTSVTDAEVGLSWNPGTIVDHIDGYKVYWGVQSGTAAADPNNPYPFDSVSNNSQATFDGTSAVITGLTPGTQYYFTVTALSNYDNPANSDEFIYESLLFPRQAPAVPVALPIEVTEATSNTCTAGEVAEVTGLTLRNVGPTTLDICWNQMFPADPCVTGYEILHSAQPDNVSTSLVTVGRPNDCTQVDYSDTNDPLDYYLVRAIGTGGAGP